jgi:hypothetical protein
MVGYGQAPVTRHWGEVLRVIVDEKWGVCGKKVVASCVIMMDSRIYPFHVSGA